jgi:membrane protein implicated in regulation of membrane protease activity
VGWYFWALLAVALAVGELLTPGLFFLGPVALGAAAATLAALLGVGTIGSVLVFIGASLASLGLLRPMARRHLRMPVRSRTGTDALVGRRALVTQRVDANGGRVRIGGEEWTARAYVDDQVLLEGQRVDIIEIEGATALVAE